MIPEKIRTLSENNGYRFYPHSPKSCAGLYQKRIKRGNETLYFIDIFIWNFQLEFPSAPFNWSFDLEVNISMRDCVMLVIKSTFDEDSLTAAKLREMEELVLTVYESNNVVSYSSEND